MIEVLNHETSKKNGEHKSAEYIQRYLNIGHVHPLKTMKISQKIVRKA